MGSVPFSRSVTPLDQPAWSLLFEVIASVAFGFGLWRGRFKGLAVVLGIASMAAVLRFVGRYHVGWERETFFLGFIRVASGFGLGVWLYSAKLKVPQIHVGWLSLLLATILLCPIRSVLLEAAFLFVLFPLIVLAAREGQQLPFLCKWSGELSYPLYIIHAPFYALLAITGARGYAVAGSAILLASALALAVWKLYDRPVRARLTLVLTSRDRCRTRIQAQSA
jgi:peptidoglycan/LPS O-acetylase OafA/YrhL